MSKTEELRRLYGKKDLRLNQVVGVDHHGDTEDGDELGDLIASDEKSALDTMIDDESGRGRGVFLKRLFVVLRQILTPEEIKFIKLRFTAKKTDKQIAVWLGIEKNVNAVFSSINKKIKENERTIKRLAERSEWDGAELFIMQLTKTVKELSKDEIGLNKYKQIRDEIGIQSGFTVAENALQEAEHRLNAPERERSHRRFYMRGLLNGLKVDTSSLDIFSVSSVAAVFALFSTFKTTLERALTVFEMSVEENDVERFTRDVERIGEKIEELKADLQDVQEYIEKTKNEELKNIIDKMIDKKQDNIFNPSYYDKIPRTAYAYATKYNS